MLLILQLALLHHVSRLKLELRIYLRDLLGTRSLVEMHRLRLDLIKHAYRGQHIVALRGASAPMLSETNDESFEWSRQDLA